MTPFRLHPLSVAHAELIAALHARCFDTPWTADALTGLLGLPGSLGLVVEAPAPAGFVLAAACGEEAEILSIAVLPEHRRHGLGLGMLAALIDQLRQRGVSRLILEVAADNDPAHTFYAGIGLTQVGRRRDYYKRDDGTMDAIVMAGALQDLRISNR